jgi:DNA-binding NtrC family response regulator
MGELNSWLMEMTSCGLEALERVQNGLAPDLVVLDVIPGDSDSLHTLRWLHRARPATPVLVISSADGCRQVVESTQLGLEDCLVKPCEAKELERALKRHMLGREAMSKPGVADSDIEVLGDDLFFVAASQAMRVLRARTEMLAQVNVPVLIIGEYGCGKETAARLMHRLSIRSPFPFLKVNCAALPVDLLSRELLGYEIVSVRGQIETKPGKLEMCHNGTLFLEDIDHMPDGLMSKLLPVLQQGRFVRLGGETAVRTDVRILASLSPNGDSQPNHDLYLGFGKFALHVPPLRERAEDIPLLIGNFMSRLARKYGLATRQVSAKLLAECQTHSWPGNLHELENFVKRFLIIGDDSLLLAETADVGPSNGDRAESIVLSPEIPAADGPPKGNSDTSLKSLVRSAKGEAEKNAITHALETTRWNRKAAARLLRISYRALLYKIQEYRMSPADPSVVVINGRNKANGRENL